MEKEKEKTQSKKAYVPLKDQLRLEEREQICKRMIQLSTDYLPVIVEPDARFLRVDTTLETYPIFKYRSID